MSGTTEWHVVSSEEALQVLESDAASGLTGEAVKARLSRHGPNELVGRGGRSPWAIVRGQLSETMVIILLVAAVASVLVHEYTDAAVILVIIVMNTIIGFRQEYRAEKAMAALKKLAVPAIRVRRGGGETEVPSSSLVPGDVMLLEAGDLVPADARILEGANLKVQESALTGESVAVEKTDEELAGKDLPVADRRNMVFTGTAITYGRATAVVTATGMKTELGRIAEMLQSVTDEKTPLQKRLHKFGRGLAWAALAIVAIIFVIGLARGQPLKQMFLTAVSMAVAAVPEGLPAVVTVALALGATRMYKRRALVRRLPAVEALGSVTVICSDKTGTLTQNRMTVTRLMTADDVVEVDEFLREGRKATEKAGLPLLTACLALCTDASLKGRDGPAGGGPPERSGPACAPKALGPAARSAEDGPPEILGDPTEGALVVAAERLGLSKRRLAEILPRKAEVPFDSNRKRMTTVHAVPENAGALPAGLDALAGAPAVALVKGAVDSLLDVSSRVWTSGEAEALSGAWKERLSRQNEDLSAKGIRVLGAAFRRLDHVPESPEINDTEVDLTFLGMVAMVDPLRDEVPPAVAMCRTAGIRPVMITGDHPLTARNIACQAGMIDGGRPSAEQARARVVTGEELSRTEPGALESLTESASVYARVSPEHKYNIVQALQARGHVVAMTGDGVNDAPALKKADVGVAMGITGTDVSKEASDIVLLDDNFATIVAAVEEGRIIYSNVRKFIKYLLTSNAGEVWVMLLAMVAAPEGMRLALLPLQILWINLVTDGAPALALGFEPPEPDIMERPPVKPTEGIFAHGMAKEILWLGLLMSLLSLGTGVLYHDPANPADRTWQTMVFTVLCFAQMWMALSVRAERRPVTSVGLFTNRPLLVAVAVSVALQIAVIYVPYLQTIFGTVPLAGADLAVAFGASALVFVAAELVKLSRALRARRSAPEPCS